MTIRDLNATLKGSLVKNDSFLYAHLVKFEKPVVEAGSIPSRSATSYTHITDSSYPITYDDGSVDAEGNSNGSQIYMPNRLLGVSNITETIEARASTFNLNIAANAIGTSSGAVVLNTTASSVTIQTTSATDFVELGFIEGHEVDVVAGSETATVRINSFQDDNRTASITIISGSLSTQNTVNGSLALNTPDISALLSDKDAGSYARYINREVFIYKAHIDIDTGNIVGEPFLIFKGIINSGKFIEDPVKGSKVSWGVTSHWGDFIAVKGRRTSDEQHRALKGDGTPDVPALIRPEYGSDLGFMHSEQALNIIAIYQATETKIRVKSKSGFLGFGSKVKTEEYDVLVDRETDLRFNLDAKYLPVIYGVRRVDSIPFFADTDQNDAAKIYVAYAICEGEVQGLYDIYFEETSSICLNKQDFDTRSTQTTENTVPILCSGRMDRGDVLTGINPGTGTNLHFDTAAAGSLLANGWTTGFTGFFGPGDPVYDQLAATFNLDTNSASANGTTSSPNSGVIHEKGRTFNDPIDCRLTFHSGKPYQKADTQLVNKAAAGSFKLQNDYYDGDKATYWGPNHQVLDTAYVVAAYTINEGEIEIPSLEFVVKGKIVECYNYDYTYALNSTETSAALSAFEIGTAYSIYNSSGSDTGTTAVIAWKGEVTIEDGTREKRVRFTDLPINTDTHSTFSLRNGGNILYFAAHDHVFVSGNVPGRVSSTVSSVAASSDTNNPGVDITVASGALSNSIGSDFIRIAPIYDTYEDLAATQVLGTNPLLFSFSTSNTSASTTLTNVGTTSTGASTSTISNVVAKNAVRLPSSASTTAGIYDNLELEVYQIFADGSKYSEIKKIVDYVGGTDRVAIVDTDFDPNNIPGSGYQVRVINRGDLRVTNNPAMQLLDYLTSTRYGRGLELDQDIDLPSFKETGRNCDTRSDVYVKFTSAPSVNDVLTFKDGSKVLFQGTVASVSGTLVRLTDCIGKFGVKWEDWKVIEDGQVYWSKGNYARATSTSTQSEPTTKPTLTIQMTRESDSAAFTVDKTNYSFEGNPFVKFYNGVNWVDGYTLYDSDGVKYWRYLGWEYQDQEFVTRHQTNIVIGTEKPVFENVNNILKHFNGILRYTDGKYQLDLRRGQEAIRDTITDNSVTYYPTIITEDDILGSINIEDPGTKGTYNTVSVSIPDPANRFDTRSVTFLDSNYLKQDRNVPRKGDVKTPGITNYFTTRLNAKQYLEESRYGLKINFTLPPKGYLLLAGEIIDLTYPALGFDTKPFRVTNVTLSENCLVKITAQEHTESAYLIGDPQALRGGLGPPTEPTPANIGTPNPVSDLAATTTTPEGIVITWSAPAGFNSDYDIFEIWAAKAENFTGNSPSTDDAVLIAETRSNSYVHVVPTENAYTPVSRYYWIRVRRVKSTNQVIHSAYYPSIVGSPLPTGILGTTARAASSAVINFSNPTPLIDRNASPVDYSATTGTVTVRIGNSLLPYDNTSPQSNFSFNIETTTETGLTAGTITVNSPNTSVSLGEASAWDGTTDSPRVTYLITVKDALGNVEEYSITQNFVLTALPGTGADGRDGVSLQLTCQPVTFVYNSNDNDYDPQSTSTLSLVVDGFTYNSQKLSFAQNTSYGDTIVDSVNPNTGETTFDSINSSTLNTINQNPVEITATISAGTYSNGTTFDVANGDDAFTVTSFIPVIANGLTGETGDDGGAGFFFIKRNDTSSTGGLGPPAVPGEVPSPEVGNVAIVENSYTASQRAVSLSAGSQVFTYDGSGTPDASPTTITTTTSNFTGTRYYEFLLDGETVKGPTTANFYDYTPPTNYQTVDEVVEVKVREGSSTAEVLASDQITLFGLESSGTDVNIVLSNETHIIPVNDSGTPTYTGSGTTIRVYRGATALIHDSLSTQSNNTFRITSVSAIGITADTIADGNNTITATFTDASNITADVASITYTINVKDSSGNNTEYTRTQILTKSKFVKPIQKAYKYTGGSPDPWEEIELIRTGVLAADAVTATQLAISNLTDVPVGKESGIFMDATNLRIQIFDQGVERIRIGKLR